MTKRSRLPSAGPRILVRGGSDESAPYERITLRPQAATVGALVEGVDLRSPLDDETWAELGRARREWKVLFFVDQHLSVAEHAAFAHRLGDVIDDTLIAARATDPVDNVVVFTRDKDTVGYENLWHSDGTFRPEPTVGTILRAIEVPPLGGDTLFADMAAAYDNLPEPIAERVLGLRARHDWSKGAYADKYADRLVELREALPPVEHPVVIKHPFTGRPTLFVNPLFTTEIVGLDPDESDRLLAVLFGMATLPELQVRWRWSPGSIAFWDNIACQHYGANDYFPARRVMARATYMSRTPFELVPA